MSLWEIHGETQSDIRVGIGELSIGAMVNDGFLLVVDIAAATVDEEIATVGRLQLWLFTILCETC